MGKPAPSAPPLVQATVPSQQTSPSTLYQNMNNANAPKNTRISALSNKTSGNNNNNNSNNTHLQTAKIGHRSISLLQPCHPNIKIGRIPSHPQSVSLGSTHGFAIRRHIPARA
mmetsp:Transcript_7645/g.11354  ORF Transcript_7645/g.11354 Transcript_7645/m.11354 type:complete len:113 (+) Transcript_7645:111-449(+)